MIKENMIPMEIVKHLCNVQILKTVSNFFDDKAYLDLSNRLDGVILDYEDIIRDYQQLKYSTKECGSTDIETQLLFK